MILASGTSECCAGEDLFFARDLNSGRIFFVCAACATAGSEISTCYTDIRKVHLTLAPSGWRLATREEVEAAGLSQMIGGDAPEGLVDLVAWYPGLRLPGRTPP